jgi:hypothetical protein
VRLLAMGSAPGDGRPAVPFGALGGFLFVAEQSSRRSRCRQGYTSRRPPCSNDAEGILRKKDAMEEQLIDLAEELRPKSSGLRKESTDQHSRGAYPFFGRSEEEQSLECRIASRLEGRIRNFRLLLLDDGVILRGRSHTYYGKQLAQELVMQTTDLSVLANEIEVQ